MSLTRAQADAILCGMMDKVITVGGYRIRARDTYWSYQGRWITMDLEVLHNAGGVAVLPANPNWQALQTALGLDQLTVTNFQHTRIDQTRERVYAEFSA
jgi:hypothetical protein